MALNLEQHYAGGNYTDCDDIIFEEFMARGQYITKEPAKLENLYSTVDRKRGVTRVWLAGNTITRVNPYMYEWGLQQKITRQKQGTIIVEDIPVKNSDGEQILDENDRPVFTTIACEYCAQYGRTNFAIGNTSSMVNSGAWQTDPQPKLPKSYKEYKVAFRMIFQYQAFMFISELLRDNDSNICWFIYPKKPLSEIKKGSIVFSDRILVGSNYQRNIYDPSFRDKKLRLLLDTFRESNIFYSSDSCGTDFKQVIDFTIKR